MKMDFAWLAPGGRFFAAAAGILAAVLLALTLTLAACGGGNVSDGAEGTAGSGGNVSDGAEGTAGSGGNVSGGGTEAAEAPSAIDAPAPDDARMGGSGSAGDSAKPDVHKLEKGDSLTISLADVTATATFYPLEVDGTALEILALRTSDGSVRTAFNTCQVCYSSGRGYYVQEDDELVCQNCGNRFKASDVELVHGGCNPVPITAENKTQDEESITISYDYISQAIPLFSNWR